MKTHYEDRHKNIEVNKLGYINLIYDGLSCPICSYPNRISLQMPKKYIVVTDACGHYIDYIDPEKEIAQTVWNNDIDDFVTHCVIASITPDSHIEFYFGD